VDSSNAVIPAKAGNAGLRIQQRAMRACIRTLSKAEAMDSRLRGNDEGKARE
jgi:hypothetical protein